MLAVEANVVILIAPVLIVLDGSIDVLALAQERHREKPMRD